MSAKDKKEHQVVTPEPPQVMDPSKPPIPDESRKGSTPRKESGRRSKKVKPKPKLRKS